MDPYGFPVAKCKIERDSIDLEAVRDRLYLYGKIIGLGERGIRFVPNRREWPVAWIHPSGMVELAYKDLFHDDVVACVRWLSRTLEVRISSDLVDDDGPNPFR
jgi:hypothetical protein